MPENLWFWRFCLVTPLTAIGVQTSRLHVCRANFAHAKGVGRWGRAGGRGESNFAIFISFMWCHSWKGRAGMFTFPAEEAAQPSFTQCFWVKSGIFTIWKIKILWLGKSLSTTKHTEGIYFLPVCWMQDKNIQLLKCIQVSLCYCTNTVSSNLFTFLSTCVLQCKRLRILQNLALK